MAPRTIGTRFGSVRKLIGYGIAAPLAVAATGVLLVSAAGQAVGPVLSGGISGSAGLVVEQALVLTDGSEAETHSLADDALLVINDEGTSFTAAMELRVGDTGNFIFLEVENVSDADANAILELSVPKGMDVEDTGDSVQMGPHTWLFEVDAGDVGLIDMQVSPRDNLRPGFYTISGRIIQITG